MKNSANWKKLLCVFALAAGTMVSCKGKDAATEETTTMETTTMEQDTMATPAPVAPEVPGDTTTTGMPASAPAQ